MKMKKTNAAIVAEICLYGNGPTGCGAGWLAKLTDGVIFGTGEPKSGRGFTEAVWLALEEIRAKGVNSGRVNLYASCGNRKAVIDVNFTGYYGDIKWGVAPVYVVSASEIEKAGYEIAVS
jgi:hypothetical protein